MLATIIGAALAFSLLGLPLAIIGLFVQSLLAQRAAMRAELAEISVRIANPQPRRRRPKASAGTPLYPLLMPTVHAAPIASPDAPRQQPVTSVSSGRHSAAERPRATPDPHVMDPHVIVAAAPIQNDRRASTAASGGGA